MIYALIIATTAFVICLIGLLLMWQKTKLTGNAQPQLTKEEMTIHFKSAALDVLKDQTKLQSEGLNAILTPLKEQMNAYKKSIDDVAKTHHVAQGKLDEQLRNLFTLNQTLSKEAQDLTNAIKGSKKIQGDIGEMQLERILELSGLKKGINYSSQEVFKTGDGIRRTDIVVTLPDDRKIVIDSKVSLAGYLDYVRSDDPVEKTAALKRYQGAIENHIKTLASKDYQGALKDKAFDYVFMFIPLEHAFIDLLQTAPNLYELATKNNIALTTPSSLFPLLRIVEQLWQTERQNKNVMEIAKLGGSMYDKLAGSMESMEDVDRKLKQASDSYDKAYKQLFSGAGNLSRMAERMKELGAKTSKQIQDTEKKLLEP